MNSIAEKTGSFLSTTNTEIRTTWFSDITTRFLFLDKFWEDRVSTNHLSGKATCVGIHL